MYLFFVIVSPDGVLISKEKADQIANQSPDGSQWLYGGTVEESISDELSSYSCGNT